MITQRIVPENERVNFYPSITKKYIFFEAYSYLLADKYIADYSGGYYEFVELIEDGQVVGRFTYPTTSEGKVRLVNVDNYTDVTLSVEGAGLALFMMCYSDYARDLYYKSPADSEHFTMLYFQLKDYVCTHHESDKILAFLD